MSRLIKSIGIRRAYLARLYPLCIHFTDDDVAVFMANNNVIFGGMSPKSAFEFSIRRPPNKSLTDFIETPIKEAMNIQFTASKDDFIKILAPFSKSGGTERPKSDTDVVSLEVRDSGIRFIQDKLYHESKIINAKIEDGVWIQLPSDAWEFSVPPNMLSEYTLRMASSGGPTIKLKQEGDALWIISDAGKERVTLQASKPLDYQIDVSRLALMRVIAQLNDYEYVKLGVRNSFLMIEGYWKQGICKWKLDAI